MAVPAEEESAVSQEDIVLRLPHPYLAEYILDRRTPKGSKVARSAGGATLYRVVPSKRRAGAALPVVLHNRRLFFTEISTLKSSELPPQSNNTAWARATRSPGCSFVWDDEASPNLAQIWLLVYVILTIQPGMEQLRLELKGKGATLLGRQIRAVGLAMDYPFEPPGAPNEIHVLVLRSTFWQGAGSPFGSKPVWLPESTPECILPAPPGPEMPPCCCPAYPTGALHHTMTTVPIGPSSSSSSTHHLARHPLRPAKPRPGSVIYSRFVPHLRETFSMVALDPTDRTHVGLFHAWQNDPRVSQGWNESGTLQQHQAYLDALHASPAHLPVLARFDGTFFAYFELYWAKEDRLDAFYDAGDFDRGRHALVGDVRFRGPRRAAAWWACLVHYAFLDDVRTVAVVGEPKDTNTSVVAYDLTAGFGVERLVDLPHKRAALVRCSRERFFQLCPLGDGEKVVGGLKIGLVPKL